MKRHYYATLILLALIPACSSSTAPDPVATGSLRLELPANIQHGIPFTLGVTALSDGALDPGVSGTIALTASAGSLSPSAITLAGGSAEGEFTLSGVAGPVAVTAAGQGLSGTSEAVFVLFDLLPGAGNDPAAEAFPAIWPASQPEDFTLEAPGLEGMPVSLRTLLVLLAPGATVGEMNALLAASGGNIIGGRPGTEVTGGILVLRFPVEDYADLLALRDELGAASWVRAVSRDAVAAVKLEPHSDNGPAPNWIWGPEPGGGNWGLELVRAPQLWNLNAAIESRGRRVKVGILDNGFLGHPDVDFLAVHGADAADDHGTFVSGIIAARWDGAGIDGINPFADLVARETHFWVTPDAGPLDRNTDWGQCIIGSLLGMLLSEPELVAINMSVGYPNVLNTQINVAMQHLATEQGELVADVLSLLPAHAARPLIIVAAGNESNDGFGLQDAVYASPMCNAALAHGVERIIVVESVARDAEAAGGATRSDFSNVGGFISAPGSSVMSTSVNESGTAYTTADGTSFSTPYVTGLLAYLLALAPELTHQQLRDILEQSAVIVDGDASPRLDAFGAALAVDWVRGDDAVLRMLLDIDDGTEDGNQRVDYATGAAYTDEDADGDGGLGDGAIDMSDFRRFRDWLLQVEDGPGVHLDGAADHPKKDVDGNGEVEDAGSENVFPRADFNGDGKLDRTATAYVGGAVNAILSDLGVLQRVFSDPDVEAGELPGLLDSADLWLDAGALLAVDGAASVIFNVIEPEGPTLVAQRVLTPSDSTRILTIPVRPEGYRLQALLQDGAANTMLTVNEDIGLQRGEDKAWRPEGEPSIVVELTFPASIAAEAAAPLGVRAGLDSGGGPVWTADLQVQVAVTAGSAYPDQGTTDANGEFDSSVTPAAGVQTVTVFVTVSDGEGHSSVATAQASVTSLGDIFASSTSASVSANVNAYGLGGHGDGDSSHTFGSWNGSASAHFEDPWWHVTGNASGSTSSEVLVEGPDSRLLGCSGTATGSASVSSQSASHPIAAGFSGTRHLEFTVPSGEVVIQLTAVITLSGLGSLSVDFWNDTTGDPVLFVALGESGAVNETLSLGPGSYVFGLSGSCGAALAWEAGGASGSCSAAWDLVVQGNAYLHRRAP